MYVSELGIEYVEFIFFFKCKVIIGSLSNKYFY